jgi:CheY-like chemotaxis protein
MKIVRRWSMTKPRILIADDDRQLVSNLEMVLAKEPFAVCFVDSAEKEIEEARKGGYDLIVTDLQMPQGKEGIYAIKEIRKFDKKVPIVLHTSYHNDEIKQEALQAGADHVAWKHKMRIYYYGKMIKAYMRR